MARPRNKGEGFVSEEREEENSRTTGAELDALALLDVEEFLCDNAGLGDIFGGYCPV